MTLEELVAKQQLRIEELEIMLKGNRATKLQLINKVYGIGQPLNDNVLGFNDQQMRWCQSIAALAEEIEYIQQ